MLFYSLGSQETELTQRGTSNVALLTSLCCNAPSDSGWHCWDRQSLSTWREGGIMLCVTVTQRIEANKLKGSQQNKSKSQTDRNSKSLGAGGPQKYLIFEPWPTQGIRLHGRTQETSSKQMPMPIAFFLNTDRPPKARWRNVVLRCLWIPNSVPKLSSSWWTQNSQTSGSNSCWNQGLHKCTV